MPQNLNSMIYLFLIIILIVLGTIFYIEDKKYAEALKKLNMANAQMDILKQQSLAQQQKIEEANKQSRLKEKESQEKLKNIMRINIPKDCQQSIQWGIKKAYEF